MKARNNLPWEGRVNLTPGRWWRVLDNNGKVWCETSSEEEARAAHEKGYTLQRLYVAQIEEWRDEE